ncbi:acyl-CoA dehydrogenase family protein [Ferribacterium limneticum]|uniref:acyl-CoA dehydrogenase family protein n=1 Tax=Ferribacterium limneticum TaxID=76259 RepID=UPI001CF8A516|nr:acyl-CoA dehydrogenase family protein [Ferribacterium limneticum]UCV23664.1 hypothetical protein KI613_03755 [Ferribacterium limneticum]
MISARPDQFSKLLPNRNCSLHPEAAGELGPVELLGFATQAISVVESVLLLAIQYTSTRKRSHSTGNDFTETRCQLADLWAEAATQRAIVDCCLRRHFNRQLKADEAFAAKQIGELLQERAVNSCLQIVKRYGYKLRYSSTVRACPDVDSKEADSDSEIVIQEIIRRSLTDWGRR